MTKTQDRRTRIIFVVSALVIGLILGGIRIAFHVELSESNMQRATWFVIVGFPLGCALLILSAFMSNARISSLLTIVAFGLIAAGMLCISVVF